MKSHFHLLGIAGFVMITYGALSAIFKANPVWYSWFVIGGTLFLAWLNHLLDNDSLFSKRISYILKTYIVYVLITIGMESLFRGIMHLWHFPFFNLMDEVIHVFMIGYPFIFFFMHEGLKLMKLKISSMRMNVILATIIFMLASEIPNTFAWEWIYTIPYITFEILQINIIVMIGWLTLTPVPLLTRYLLDSKD